MSLASLAVVLALTAALGGSALASTRLDGNGDIAVQAAPKASHKPKPGTTPAPTPRPTPKPTPKPTAKPTPRPTARPAAATPAPKPRPKPNAAESPLPSSAATTPRPAVLTTTDRREPGIPISVLSIGQQPLAIAVSIVSLAGVLLLGAWFVLGRRRPVNRAADSPPELATAASPAATPAASSPPPDAPEPRRRRDALRLRRSSRQVPAADPERRIRAARFDEVFADSPMRRVVQVDRVELLNVPHEVYGIPLTEIVSGREVELIEHQDSWAKVRTPWGQEGWLPAKSLGT